MIGGSMSTAILKREIITNKSITEVIWISFFVLATTFGAYVRIPLPFTPVPITLQTFFVLLSGAILGKKFGSISQLSYFLLGGLGLPLFTQVGALWGPTGGYILGFVLASYLIGFLLEKNWKVFYVMLLGDFILLLSGTLNLSFYVGSFKNAVILGMFPFIAGDILKIVAVVFVFNTYNNSHR
jgi:biotin transport system substrate-specific component